MKKKAPAKNAPLPISGLGDLSAHFESGGRGVATISSGKGDPGGVSYGAHQLASKTGTMAAFLKSKQGAPYAQRFAGSTPGTAQFNNRYREVVKEDPEGFATAQRDYIAATHYTPVQKVADKLGFNTASRGVQEALFSMSVQHGAAKSIVARAAKIAGALANPKAMVEALYAARRSYVKGLRKVPPKTKDSILARFDDEEPMAARIA